MGVHITITQLGRFIWMAILLEAVVYAVTGMICWYRYGLSIHYFSIGLSWAGLGLMAIAGVIFMAAKPKTKRPTVLSTLKGSFSRDKEGAPLDQMPSFTGNLFSSLNPMSGRSLFGEKKDADPSTTEEKEPTEADIASEKNSRIKLYYNSGLAAAIGVLTIASSEFFYRLAVESTK